MKNLLHRKKRSICVFVLFVLLGAAAEMLCIFILSVLLLSKTDKALSDQYIGEIRYCATGMNRMLEETPELLKTSLPKAALRLFILAPFDYDTDWYAVLKDDETGEILADTMSDFHLILRFGEDEQNLPGISKEMSDQIVYACSREYFGRFVETYREELKKLVDGRNRSLFWQYADGWEERNAGEIRFKPLEVYLKDDGSFLPGRIRIERENYWGNVIEETVVDCTPDSTEGYSFLKLEENSAIRHCAILAPRFNRTTVVRQWLPALCIEDYHGEASQESWRSFIEESERSFLDLEHSGRNFITDRNVREGELAYVFSGQVREPGGRTCTIYCSVRHTKVYWNNLFEYCGYFILGVIVTGLIYSLLFWYFCRKNRLRLQKRMYRKMLVECMAKDLKVPMSDMSAAAKKLKENIHTEKCRDYAESILKCIGNTNEVISRNLEISRLDAEEWHLRRGKADLVKLCQKALDERKEKIQEKHLKLTVSGESVVRGDTKLLQKAFDRLIQNAVQYAEDGGEIEILGKGHQLSIHNTTALIYDGRLQRLWEPFVTGETNDGESGCGLGLYIAAGILRRHKWKYRLIYNKERKLFECRIRVPWGVLF